jgi:hypothetical protein
MATIEKRGDSYRIVASAGYGSDGKQIRKRMTWTPSEGLTARQIEKELDRQAVLFEEQVKNGQYIDASIRFADYTELWLKNYGEKHLAPAGPCASINHDKHLCPCNTISQRKGSGNA